MKFDHNEGHDPAEDKAAAIKNLGGMTWLYDKHLLKFKLTYADSHKKTLEYLLQGKTGEARILIHSVKGLSGTLGLMQLHYAASILEKAIMTPDSYLDQALSNYEIHLNNVIKNYD